jgi:hypothetical protein
MVHADGKELTALFKGKPGDVRVDRETGEIRVVKPDGTELHQVPIPSCGSAFSDTTSIGCPQASWSPDGTKIVFGRVTANGHHEHQDISTVNADGSGLSQVTYNGVKDFSPDWGTHPLAT